MNLPNKIALGGFLIFSIVLFMSPLFFWGRWAFRSYKRESKWEFGIASFSLILFIAGLIYPFICSRTEYERTQTTSIAQLLHYLSLFILAFVPPGFFISKWIGSSFKHGKRIIKIISISLLLMTASAAIYANISFYKMNKVWMAENLGINIPTSGTDLIYEEYPNILDYPNGTVRAQLKFEEKTAALIEKQIRSSAFFNMSKKELLQLSVDQENGLALKYNQITDHLRNEGLTGLWIFDTRLGTYQFCEPQLSNLPNAKFLFGRSYRIIASLDPKTRTLYYQFIIHK